MQDSKQIILMCGKGDCCPIITFNKDKVLITDDFGGRVRLTKEQFNVLKNKVKKGEL